MNNVATRAAWTAPRALTVNQLFSSAWKDSNPCKYKAPSTAWPRWGEREGGMEGRVSNLTFDPTNKRHVSFRIALQRGAPVAEWASFVILAVRAEWQASGGSAALLRPTENCSTTPETDNSNYWLSPFTIHPFNPVNLIDCQKMCARMKTLNMYLYMLHRHVEIFHFIQQNVPQRRTLRHSLNTMNKHPKP